MGAGAGYCNNAYVLRWLWCASRCVGGSWANRGVGDNQLVGVSIGRNIDGYGFGDALAWAKLAALVVTLAFTVSTLTVITV